LSVLTIAKDEAPYIKEWLEYHLLVGVEKFYFYDNGSTDNSREILQPYIDAGIVEYIYFPGTAKQYPAYRHCLRNFRLKTKWLAVVDLDEFIVPLKNKDVPSFIKELANKDEHISQILMGWCIYGSSGHKKKPEGLVTENFLYREREFIRQCKCIINPRKAYGVHPHCFKVLGKTIDENRSETMATGLHLEPNYTFSNSKIRVNHYAIKSYEEFLIKKYKGDVLDDKIKTKDEEYFKNYDRNDVKDDVMMKYIPDLKKRIHRS
jgi:glycosyltransferase involved in cell wall biosynthesis